MCSKQEHQWRFFPPNIKLHVELFFLTCCCWILSSSPPTKNQQKTKHTLVKVQAKLPVYRTRFVFLLQTRTFWPTNETLKLKFSISLRRLFLTKYVFASKKKESLWLSNNFTGKEKVKLDEYKHRLKHTKKHILLTKEVKNSVLFVWIIQKNIVQVEQKQNGSVCVWILKKTSRQVSQK